MAREGKRSRVRAGCHAGDMTEQAPAHRHHSIDYIEIPALDVAAAKQFYSAAFGWGFNDYGPEYAGIQDPAVDGREAGGICRADETGSGGPLVILYSDDLDASLAAVVAAGGIIANGPYDFPGGRRFHFNDPSGNELAVWSHP